MDAYGERNRLVSFLSALFPACIAPHVGEEWDVCWRNVIIIETPAGQMSWHIHSDELPVFAHLPNDGRYKWDGHTTAEKYERLERLKSMFAGGN